MVTVAFSRCSNSDTGLPTILLLPITTACLPDISSASTFNQFNYTGWGTRKQTIVTNHEITDIDRMESIHIFLHGNGINNCLLIDMLRQWKLNQNSVNAIVDCSACPPARADLLVKYLHPSDELRNRSLDHDMLSLYYAHILGKPDLPRREQQQDQVRPPALLSCLTSAVNASRISRILLYR